jgi:hypothetical protein
MYHSFHNKKVQQQPDVALIYSLCPHCIYTYGIHLYFCKCVCWCELEEASGHHGQGLLLLLQQLTLLYNTVLISTYFSFPLMCGV